VRGRYPSFNAMLHGPLVIQGYAYWKVPIWLSFGACRQLFDTVMGSVFLLSWVTLGWGNLMVHGVMVFTLWTRSKSNTYRFTKNATRCMSALTCNTGFIMYAFNFFNQRMHLFVSVQFTLHMFRPWRGHHQGCVDKFTSLFTAPFGIITTVTLFKAINYVGNHQYTQFLQVVSWNVLVYSISQGWPNRGSRATCGSLIYNVRLAEICWLSPFLHHNSYKG
jgi:ABC-type xylose transport system permease subunit